MSLQKIMVRHDSISRSIAEKAKEDEMSEELHNSDDVNQGSTAPNRRGSSVSLQPEGVMRGRLTPKLRSQSLIIIS